MGRRSNAAFTWTDEAGQEVTHKLGSPLRDVRPRHVRARYVTEALDGSGFDSVSVGDGQWELEGTLRYDARPETLLRMMDDGAAQQTLRYWPDLTKRDYFDAKVVPSGSLYAADPDESFWFAGEYSLTVLLRKTDGTAFPASATHATVDGNRVVFRHRGGEPIDDWSFSRAAVSGADTYRKRDGTLGEVTVDDIARTHWLDLDGDGVFEEPSLLLELGQKNLVIWSDALSNWTKSHTQPTAVDASVSAGDLELSLLEDDDGTNSVYYHITPSFTGDGQKSVAVAIKEGTATQPRVLLRDTSAGATRLNADFTFSSGVPSATMNVGTQIGDVEKYDGGIYVFRFLTTSVTAVNTHELRASPAASTGSATGTAYMGGFMAVDDEFCGSLIKTTGATVTRNVEVARHVMPAATRDPSTAWTGYFRWEAGMDGDGGVSSPRVVALGDGATNAEPGIELYFPSATSVGLRHRNGTTPDDATLTATIERGDTCEAIVTWNGDGTGTLYLWVDGTFIDSATLSGIPPADAWEPDGSGNVNVYYNSRDAGTNAGAMSLRDSVLTEGAVSGTAAQIRSAFTRYVDQN